MKPHRSAHSPTVRRPVTVRATLGPGLQIAPTEYLVRVAMGGAPTSPRPNARH